MLFLLDAGKLPLLCPLSGRRLAKAEEDGQAPDHVHQRVLPAPSHGSDSPRLSHRFVHAVTQTCLSGSTNFCLNFYFLPFWKLCGSTAKSACSLEEVRHWRLAGPSGATWALESVAPGGEDAQGAGGSPTPRWVRSAARQVRKQRARLP